MLLYRLWHMNRKGLFCLKTKIVNPSQFTFILYKHCKTFISYKTYYVLRSNSINSLSIFGKYDPVCHFLRICRAGCQVLGVSPLLSSLAELTAEVSHWGRGFATEFAILFNTASNSKPEGGKEGKSSEMQKSDI